MDSLGQLEQRTAQCETMEEVLAMLEECGSAFLSWQSFLVRMLDDSGLSYGRFATACGISKNTVRKWCTQGGVPKSRDTFLKVGFGAAMEPETVNTMLSQFGGYPGLNPRDPFDAVCIFCLRKRSRGDSRFDYRSAEAIYRRYLPAQKSDDTAGVTTTRLMKRLLSIDAEAEFALFFQEYGASLSSRKPKLERYLADFLTVRRLEAGRETGKPASLHSLCLPYEVEKQISNLKNRGTIPRRRNLIALGLHLDMTLEELDTMLRYAGMDRLCVRDRLECVLIHVLQQLMLTHPELALGNATALLAVSSDPATRQRCSALAEEYWRACYRSEPDDVASVSRYVKCVLEQLELEEAEELLPLL